MWPLKRQKLSQWYLGNDCTTEKWPLTYVKFTPHKYWSRDIIETMPNEQYFWFLKPLFHLLLSYRSGRSISRKKNAGREKNRKTNNENHFSRTITLGELNQKSTENDKGDQALEGNDSCSSNEESNNSDNESLPEKTNSSIVMGQEKDNSANNSMSAKTSTQGINIKKKPNQFLTWTETNEES